MLIDDVKMAYRAVARGALTDAEANAIVAKIAADALTLDSYIADLTKQVASTTSAAIAIASFITGVTPTSDKLDALKAEADKQVASYTKLGVGNPALGAFEAFGKGFAEDPSTGFATKYGAMSADDFIKAVYVLAYGGAPTDAAFSNLSAQIAYFTKLYSDAGLANAALLAKGAALGQIVGYAFVDPVAAEKSKLDDQVNKLLVSAAKGDAGVFGKPLPSLDPPPASGGGTPIDPPRSFTLTDGEDKFTGGSGDDTFTAPLDIASTLTDSDALDGGSGFDTLNIHYDALTTKNANFPVATVKNIEVVNVIDDTDPSQFTFPSYSLANAANYDGVKELWQTNRAVYLTNWKADMTAGFRNVTAFSVTAAHDATSISVGVDYDTVSGSTRYVQAYLYGDALDTFIVKKARDAAPQADPVFVQLWLDLDPALKTLTVQSDFAVSLVSQSNRPNPHLETFDASASIGGVSPGFFIDSTTRTIKGGSGNDGFSIVTDTSADNPGTPNIDETITATLNAGAGDDLAFLITTGSGKTIVDMGAGNDTVKYFPSSALTVDLGDGDDIFEVRSGGPRTGDVIKGGAGFDRFEQAFSAWTQSGVMFDGVEKFIFNSGSVVDATGWTGVKEFHALGDATFSGMTSDVVIHQNNGARITANFKDVSGANDKASFFTNGGAWRITAPGIEHLSVDLNGGGDARPVGNAPLIVAPDAKTITITGNGLFDTHFGTGIAAPLLNKFDAGQLTNATKFYFLPTAHSADGLTVIAPQGAINTEIYVSGSSGGALTFVGGAGRDIVASTAYADIINVGDGGSDITSAGGADKITLGAGIDHINVNFSNTSLAAMVEISNFNASEDALFNNGFQIANIAAGQAAVSQPGVTTIEQAITAFFGAGSAASKLGWFQFKNDTYVVTYDGSAAFDPNTGDTVIKLVGLHTLSAANFF